LCTMPRGDAALENPPCFQPVIFLTGDLSFAVRSFCDVHLLIR
jgi:hypothetical protein